MSMSPVDTRPGELETAVICFGGPCRQLKDVCLKFRYASFIMICIYIILIFALFRRFI